MRIVLIILALVGYASGQEPALKFGTPINLGSPINTPGFDGGPSLSADGLTLYPASNRPDGVGRDDLWVSSRKSTHDAWQTPVNLSATINSAEGDASPSISADGLELYFDSARSGGNAAGTSGSRRVPAPPMHGARRGILGPPSTVHRPTACRNSRVMACRSSLRPPDREGLE